MSQRTFWEELRFLQFLLLRLRLISINPPQRDATHVSDQWSCTVKDEFLPRFDPGLSQDTIGDVLIMRYRAIDVFLGSDAIRPAGNTPAIVRRDNHRGSRMTRDLRESRRSVNFRRRASTTERKKEGEREPRPIFSCVKWHELSERVRSLNSFRRRRRSPPPRSEREFRKTGLLRETSMPEEGIERACSTDETRDSAPRFGSS